jgi:DNA-binding NarL/FixJ family response regulator
MTTEKITVAVVDGHTLMRGAIIDYLRQYKGAYQFELTFEGSGIGDVLHKIHQHPAEVLIMDFFREKYSNFEPIRALRKALPDQKILVISTCIDLAIIYQLLAEGINGYISKVQELELLTEAIISLHEGRTFQSDIMTKAIYFKKGPKQGPKP